MPSEQDDGLVQRLLAARQQRSTDPDAIADAAWRLAAGESLDDATRRRVLADLDGLRELGIASAVLEARGRAHADAERSADAALALVAAARRRRTRLRLVATSLTAMAAVLLVWLMAGRIGDGPIRLAAADVVATTARAGTEDGFVFRLDLQPSRRSAAVVWLLFAGADGTELQRLHPLPPEVAASPLFAAWPTGRLPSDRVTRLPPAPIDPFLVPAARAHVIVATFDVDVLDPTRLDTLQAQVREATRATLDDAAITRALQGLRAAGAIAESTKLSRP